jgi:hypothetical protein
MQVSASQESLLGRNVPRRFTSLKIPQLFELPPQPDLEAKFRSGNDVGLLAQQLFSGGTEIPFHGLSVTTKR